MNMRFLALAAIVACSVISGIYALSDSDLSSLSARQTTCSGGQRNRKEVSLLTTTEWNKYINAIKVLHRTPANGGDSNFTKFVRFHFQYASEWHGGQYFLPAHRQMLWEYENALKRIDPSVTLPYYDWSINYRRWTFDTVWNRVGGANGGPIPRAPFNGWRAYLPSNHLVTRTMIQNSLRNGDGDFVGEMESRASLSLLTSQTSRSFQSFANYLEATHGSLHNQIGGDMRDPRYSPSDPVFYLHHAFVDKIWRDWQRRGAGNKFDGFHSGVRVSTTRRMNPLIWGRTVASILTGISTCVTYQGPAVAQLAPASAPQSAATIAGAKARDGGAYKKLVEEVKKEQEALVDGATFSSLPKSSVDDALKVKRELQAVLNGVLPSDIQNPDSVLGKSDDAIEKDGEAEAEA